MSDVFNQNTNSSIKQLLDEIHRLDRIIYNANERLQTIIDEAFGPFGPDTIDNNLTVLEVEIHKLKKSAELNLQKLQSFLKKENTQ
jgi:hypothetical protein